MIFTMNIWLNISTALMIDTYGISLIVKRMLKADANYRIEDKMSMKALTHHVFPNGVPSANQLIFLKENIDTQLNARKLHRNILIAIVAFLLNVVLSITLKIPSFLPYLNSLGFMSLFLAVELIFMYATLDIRSKYVQLDYLFIKDVTRILKLQNLLNYLIYQSK